MFSQVLSLVLAMFACSGVAAASMPEVTARYTETQLRFIVPPTHIESVCGSAMFGIESRAGSDSDAWVCVAPDALTGKMVVVNWGYFGGFLNRIVRNPTPTDRNFILANENQFTALDPVTLQSAAIGTLTPPADTINTGTVFKLMPESITEILLDTASGWEIRGFPEGDLKLSQSSGSPIIGHFLSPQSTQLLERGNDDFYLFDAHNGNPVNTVAFPQIRDVFGAYDWTGSGLDSVYFSDIPVQLSSMNLSTGNAASVGGLADFQLYRATPVNWSGSSTALAGIWYDALRVFDPVTGGILYNEPMTPDPGLWPLTAFWPANYDSDGKQDLLWTTLSGDLYFLPNGSTSRYLQSASGGFQIAGTTGPSFDVLVTGDTYATASVDDHPSHLDIVVRDPATLQELWRRTDAAPADSQVFLGRFGRNTDPVLITADGGRIAAESLVNGASLWEITNDVYSTGNKWEGFAVPPANCADATCKRMLIASIAENTNTLGSFQQVIDTRTGATLWASTPDGCLGCGSRLIAFVDVNGDGVPDIVRMRPYQENPTHTGTIQLVDGATYQESWSTEVMPSHVDAVFAAVATVGTANVAVWSGTTLTLLAAADGHVITTAQTATLSDYHRSNLRFVDFGAGEGKWMAMSGSTDIEWFPADLSQPVQTLSVPAVQTISAEYGGVVFGAGREGIFRIQIPTDHLFANGFEP